MNRRAISAIIRKDLKVVLKSKAVLIPLIIVPLIMMVIIPTVGSVLLVNADPGSEGLADFRRDAGPFFENLPQGVLDRISRYDNEVQQVTYLVFNLVFPPLYLLMPTMVANVIAADSFAGEKERKTLEALLYSPVSDRELYLAKLLGPLAAGVGVGLISFFVFAAVISAITYPMMGDLFLLDLTWLVLILWVTPAAAGLGLGAMVLVSSKANTFQDAYQLGSMVVLPIVLLMLGQMGGVMYFSPLVVFAIGTVLWLITAGLVGYGGRSFERSALISRL